MELFILCTKIFCARIMDVSLGTVRTVLTVKGKKGYASLIGFIEVLIWFIIVQEAMNTELTSIAIALSYAGGYATGTYIGGFISQKFIPGTFGVQIITSIKKSSMIDNLRKEGYAVSVINVKGQEEDKLMLFIEIDKKRFNHLQSIVKELDDKAFLVVNETKMVQNGYFK